MVVEELFSPASRRATSVLRGSHTAIIGRRAQRAQAQTWQGTADGLYFRFAPTDARRAQVLR